MVKISVSKIWNEILNYTSVFTTLHQASIVVQQAIDELVMTRPQKTRGTVLVTKTNMFICKQNHPLLPSNS